MVDTDFVTDCISGLGSTCCMGEFGAVQMSYAASRIRLRYRVYAGLRCVCSGDNFFVVDLAPPGLGV